MIKKIELAKTHEIFAEPTPLGLIGLAIGCAALTPIAFGSSLTPAGLSTAAVFCLLFGGGCQFLAGLMNFANKNLFGGTILTAFSFAWMLNYWALDSLAHGVVPDHGIVLATDVLSLVLFAVLTYGFGFFSKLLFFFLFDIDVLYACKVYKGFFPTKALDLPIAVATVLLGAIALYIAFAALINPTAGRAIFPMPGPLFAAAKKPSFDWTLRRTIFDVLFEHWKENAFKPVVYEELLASVRKRVGDSAKILPDLAYLMELGAVVVTTEEERVVNVRLSAEGIDLYEQLVFRKYEL